MVIDRAIWYNMPTGNRPISQVHNPKYSNLYPCIWEAAPKAKGKKAKAEEAAPKGKGKKDKAAKAEKAGKGKKAGKKKGGDDFEFELE